MISSGTIRSAIEYGLVFTFYLLSCLAGCSGRGAEEGVVKAPPCGLRARRLQASRPGQAGRVVRIAENTRRQSSRRLPDEQFQPGSRTSVQVCTEGDVFAAHIVVVQESPACTKRIVLKVFAYSFRANHPSVCLRRYNFHIKTLNSLKRCYYRLRYTYNMAVHNVLLISK